MSRSYIKDRFEARKPVLSDTLIDYWENLILRFASEFGASSDFSSYLSENIVSKITNHNQFFKIDNISNPFAMTGPNVFSYCNFKMDDKNKFSVAEFVTKYPILKMIVTSKFDKKFKLLELSINYYNSNEYDINKTKKMLCPLHEEVLLFKIYLNRKEDFIKDILPSAVIPYVFDYSTHSFDDIVQTLEMTFV